MPHHHRLNQLWSLQQSTTAVSILVAEVDWWSCNQSRTDNCRVLPSSCRCRPCRHCISVTGVYTVTLRWTLNKHSKTRQCGSFSCLIQYIQYIQQLCYATLLVVWLSLVASYMSVLESVGWFWEWSLHIASVCWQTITAAVMSCCWLMLNWLYCLLWSVKHLTTALCTILWSFSISVLEMETAVQILNKLYQGGKWCAIEMTGRVSDFNSFKLSCKYVTNMSVFCMYFVWPRHRQSVSPR